MKTCAERPPVFAGIPTVPRATVGTAHLYQWQHEALSAWAQSGCRGVVEAVTGTGKTLVGIAAAADALRDGGKVQVLVPTVELLRQWCRTLRKNLPGRRIGELGDGSDGGLPTSNVLVSVVNSARRYSPQHVPRNSLLVGDECHRYGSDSNAKALNPKFDRRLGLSATYARSDDGNSRYLDPFFGEMIYRIGYQRAIRDHVTAHFKVALIRGALYERGGVCLSRGRSQMRRHTSLVGAISRRTGEPVWSVHKSGLGRCGGWTWPGDLEGEIISPELSGQAPDTGGNVGEARKIERTGTCIESCRSCNRLYADHCSGRPLRRCAPQRRPLG